MLGRNPTLHMSPSTTSPQRNMLVWQHHAVEMISSAVIGELVEKEDKMDEVKWAVQYEDRLTIEEMNCFILLLYCWFCWSASLGKGTEAGKFKQFVNKPPLSSPPNTTLNFYTVFSIHLFIFCTLIFCTQVVNTRKKILKARVYLLGIWEIVFFRVVILFELSAESTEKCV